MPDPKPCRTTGAVLGSYVDAITYDQAVDRVLKWARAGESRCVCAAPIHSIMESWDSPRFRKVLNAADMVTPDGAPIAWALRRIGFRSQRRVTGPDLMLRICRAASEAGLPIGLFGGSERCIAALPGALKARFPALEVAYALSPPFRAPTDEENRRTDGAISASRARILFVGLGCPKQEYWMSERRGRIPAVMIGVGAAFDMHSGLINRAPAWIQSLGLEWAHRLASEPRRLFWRYLKFGPRFFWLFALQRAGILRLKGSDS